MKIDAATPLDVLLQAAKDTLELVETGEVFTVRELFRGFEWKRLPMGERIRLGSLFYVYAQTEGLDRVTIGEKTKQNQQQYIKK